LFQLLRARATQALNLPSTLFESGPPYWAKVAQGGPLGLRVMRQVYRSHSLPGIHLLRRQILDNHPEHVSTGRGLCSCQYLYQYAPENAPQSRCGQQSHPRRDMLNQGRLMIASAQGRLKQPWLGRCPACGAGASRCRPQESRSHGAQAIDCQRVFSQAHACQGPTGIIKGPPAP